MRSNDVASTSFRHRVPTRFLVNQQIFSCFTLKLKENVGGLLVWGQRVCWPPLKLLGEGSPHPLFLRLRYMLTSMKTQEIQHFSGSFIGLVVFMYQSRNPTHTSVLRSPNRVILHVMIESPCSKNKRGWNKINFPYLFSWWLIKQNHKIKAMSLLLILITVDTISQIILDKLRYEQDPVVQKLMTSLVNETLKFQTYYYVKTPPFFGE